MNLSLKMYQKLKIFAIKKKQIMNCTKSKNYKNNK